MPIESISSVGAAALPPMTPGTLTPPADSASTESELVQALSVESETLEQRANRGDLMALEQLAADEMEILPLTSQELLPAQPQQSTAPHEPGKGDIIDIYN